MLLLLSNLLSHLQHRPDLELRALGTSLPPSSFCSSIGLRAPLSVWAQWESRRTLSYAVMCLSLQRPRCPRGQAVTRPTTCWFVFRAGPRSRQCAPSPPSPSGREEPPTAAYPETPGASFPSSSESPLLEQACAYVFMNVTSASALPHLGLYWFLFGLYFSDFVSPEMF